MFLILSPVTEVKMVGGLCSIVLMYKYIAILHKCEGYSLEM